MLEKTAYANISPNSVFSVYTLIDPSHPNFSHINEVMGYSNHYWNIDNGYHDAINALLSNEGWPSYDFELNNIGELKFTFTTESHPEFFI